MYSLYFRQKLPVVVHNSLNKVLLKRDVFGEVWRITENDRYVILRDTRPSRRWVSWLARALMRREGTALTALTGIDGVPQLVSCSNQTLTRSYLKGVPIHEGRPASRAFYVSAARLLRRLHRAGVAHNDLAKEPNILLRDDGSPAFVDFQLASWSGRRGRLFRAAAREDIRHLLKHKRTYRPDLLTTREKSILSTPSLFSRIWMAVFKPIYLFVTRRIFGWSDREGAADR